MVRINENSPGWMAAGDAGRDDHEVSTGGVDVLETASAGAVVPEPAARPSAARAAGRRRFAVNAAAGGAANALKIGIQLVMLPLMAHLLGPAEFGLYALALPTVNFFMTLADAGLGLSLAREDERAVMVWSTAFWALLALGVVLGAAVAGCGVALASV